MIEFTTTDVTAALSVAGVVVTEKGKRTVGGGRRPCAGIGTQLCPCVCVEEQPIVQLQMC